MGLKDKLVNLQQNPDPTFCTLGNIIHGLDSDDKDALLSALNSPASTRAITEVLKTEGYKIDRQTITLHRKGFCRCKEGQ